MSKRLANICDQHDDGILILYHAGISCPLCEEQKKTKRQAFNQENLRIKLHQMAINAQCNPEQILPVSGPVELQLAFAKGHKQARHRIAEGILAEETKE